MTKLGIPRLPWREYYHRYFAIIVLIIGALWIVTALVFHVDGSPMVLALQGVGFIVYAVLILIPPIAPWTRRRNKGRHDSRGAAGVNAPLPPS